MSQVVTQLEDRDRLIAQLRTSKEKQSVRVRQLELRLHDIYKKVQGRRAAENQCGSRDDGMGFECVPNALEGPFEAEVEEIQQTKGTVELTAELESLMSELTSDSAALDGEVEPLDQDRSSYKEKGEVLVSEREGILKKLRLLQDEVLLLKLERKSIVKSHQMLQSEVEKWKSEVEGFILGEGRQVNDRLNQENDSQHCLVEEQKVKLATEESKASGAIEQREQLAPNVANLEMEKMHLMEELADATANVISLSAKIESLTAAHVELQSELACCATKVAAANSSRDELQGKLRSATEAVAGLRQENEKLCAEIGTLISEKQLLRSQLTQADDHLSKIAADLNILEMTRKELEKVVENLEREAADLRTALKESNAALTNWKVSNEELECKLSEKGAEIAALDTLKNDLEVRLESVSNAEAALRQGSDRFKTEIAAAVEEKQLLTMMLNEAKDHCTKITSDLRANEAARKELKKAVDNLTEESAELRTALEHSNLVVTRSQACVEELEKKLLEKNAEIAAAHLLRDELQEKLQNVSEAESTLRQHNAKLSVEMEVLADEKQAISSMLSTAEAYSSRIASDLKAEEMVRKDLEKALCNLREEAAETHTALEQANAALANSRVHSEELEGRLAETEQSMAKTIQEQLMLSTKLEAVEAEKAAMSAKLMEIEINVTALSEKNSHLVSELQAELTKSSCLKRSLVEKTTRVEELESELLSCSAELAVINSLHSELKAKLQCAEENEQLLRFKNNELSCQAEAGVCEKELLSNKLSEREEHITLLKAENDRAYKDIKAKEAEKTALEATINGLRAQNDNLNAALLESTESLADLEACRKDLQKELLCMEQAMSKVTQDLRRLSAELEAADADRRELKERLMAAERNAASLHAENSKLLDELQGEVGKKRELEDLLTLKDALITEFQSKVERSMSDATAMHTLSAELTKKLESAEEANDDLNMENRKLVTEVAELHLRLVVSNEKLSTAGEQIATLQASYERACDDLRAAEAKGAKLEASITELRMSYEGQSLAYMTVEHRANKYSTICRELDKENRSLRGQLAHLHDLNEQSAADWQRALDKAIAEREGWKQSHDALMERIAPFEEQLSSYELEKRVLEERNEATASQLSKICNKYAKLLGHQNHRQKIHYVDKLAQENVQMKQELLKLREQVHKQNVQINKLDVKLLKATGRRRAPDQENVQPDAL